MARLACLPIKKPFPFSVFVLNNFSYIQYLVDGAEDCVWHVIVNHNRRDEHFVEIDSVGPQSLVNGIRLKILGRCRTARASIRSVGLRFWPGNAQPRPSENRKNNNNIGTQAKKLVNASHSLAVKSIKKGALPNECSKLV